MTDPAPLIRLYEREVKVALAKVNDATAGIQNFEEFDWFDAQAILYGAEQLGKVVELALARARGEQPRAEPLPYLVPNAEDETVMLDG